LRRQDWEQAAQQLQRCLDLNPNFDNAMTGLARALAKLGRADDAKSWLNRAVQSNPQNYRAWYQIGLLSASGDLVVARSAYEKAIAIQPRLATRAGMLLFQQKRRRRRHTSGESRARALKKAAGFAQRRTNRLQKVPFRALRKARN
jgi:tetratricopeptide (TPR) repeat protein